ncbi:MAG: hypothetical protein IK078_00260 [Lachnospiraceae bacterium]|nr:hypothetical protein [Lachnospiraceae bacterium]
MPRFTVENTHMDVYREAKKELGSWGDKMATIDKRILEEAGLVDPRMNSINCVFDMFCMAKHQVAFQDIPALEAGTLPGHDRDAYFKEFVKFLKEHPIKETTWDGKVESNYESAKAWGELYRDANKVLGEYRLPDMNIADPKIIEERKGEMMLLSTIGTDLVQVIEGQMQSYYDPVVMAGYNAGFGTEAEKLDFHSNIVTLQNLKSLVEACHDPHSLTANGDNWIMPTLMARQFFTAHQEEYKNKTLKEFNENFPYSSTLITLQLTSMATNGLKGYTPEELDAFSAFMDKGTPLPKHLADKVEASMDELVDVYFMGTQEGAIENSFKRIQEKVPIQPYQEALENGQVNPFEMTTDQTEKALEGYAVYYNNALSNYWSPVFLEIQGGDSFDLIRINGVPIKEHTQVRYNNYAEENDVPTWDELSDAQKEEYYKIETMRATTDPDCRVEVSEVYSNGRDAVVLSDKPASLIKREKKQTFRFNDSPQTVESTERVELPEPNSFPESRLKQSYYNIRMCLDGFVTTLPSKEERAEYMESPVYNNLDEMEEKSPINKAFREDAGDAERIYMTASNTKVQTVVDQAAFEETRKNLVVAADDMDMRYSRVFESSGGRLDYGNGLMKEMNDERTMLDGVLQEQADLLERHKEEEPSVVQEEVRAREAMEKAQKALEDAQKKLEATQKRLDELGDVEPSDEPAEYNPFAPRVSKQSNEIALQHDKEDLEAAQQQVEQARALQQKVEERRQRMADEEQAMQERVERYQNRMNVIEQDMVRDMRDDVYEQYRDKARQFASAMGPNMLRRFAAGYTDAYMMTQTPLQAGIMAFGPVLDMSGSLPYKMAVSTRKGFPVYDTVIQADGAINTLADYWTEKGKAPLSDEREDFYRRKLYDQMSQVNTYLDRLYEKGIDPESNKVLKEAGITDPGNDAFHMHERAARGSGLLKASAEAYKAGLENNWAIDDLGTLSLFNYARRKSRIFTENNSVAGMEQFVKYDEPRYKDEFHKDWLDRMDNYWKQAMEKPLTSQQQRDSIFENMKELMREGFERNYIIDIEARSFSNMLEKSRKHTLAVEAGTEKLFRETENLKMGAQIGQTLQKVDQFDAVDVRGQEIKQAKEEEAAKEAEKEKEQEQEVSFSYDDQNDQTLNEEEMRNIIEGDADLSRDISTDRGRSSDDVLFSSLFGKNGENISRSDCI